MTEKHESFPFSWAVYRPQAENDKEKELFKRKSSCSLLLIEHINMIFSIIIRF